MTLGGLAMCGYSGFMYYTSMQTTGNVQKPAQNNKSMQPPASADGSYDSSRTSSAQSKKKVVQIISNMRPAPLPATIN